MEFKKKTIIWEDNNEPPKNYIWVKADGKAYEFNYDNKAWEESENIKKLAASEAANEPEDPNVEPTEEPVEEPTVEPVEDTSYLDLLRAEKAPKYFWMYNTSDTAKEIFESDVVIGGDYQSPNASRLVVDFAKINNLGLLNKFMNECHIGSIGFGFIWEPEDNFELVEGDIEGVRISNTGNTFNVKFEYYDDNFVFNPNGIYETEIEGDVYYEYNPNVSSEPEI